MKLIHFILSLGRTRRRRAGVFIPTVRAGPQWRVRRRPSAPDRCRKRSAQEIRRPDGQSSVRYTFLIPHLHTFEFNIYIHITSYYYYYCKYGKCFFHLLHGEKKRCDSYDKRGYDHNK